ncbi:sulfatase-like hydrolase/transferase [Flavobacteriaceae sp. LMIT009]
MKVKITLLWVLMLLSGLLYSQSPNVIVIIADDMGWNQVSTPLTNLNNPSDFYETPTLETLATQGIAFPHAYVNGANCAPTRAALLSGQYAARPHNNIFNVDDLNRGNTSSNSTLIGPDMGLASNNNIDEIPSSAITIAETMKTAGYTTAHFGKYHVGEYESANTSNNAPTDQGFDYNYGGGTDGGPGSGGYFALTTSAPYSFGSQVGPELDVYADPYTEAESQLLAGDSSLTGTNKHLTDALTEAALDFMEAEKSNPFFMHFSNYAIHGPFNSSDARPDLRAKYDAKAISNPSSMDHDSKPGQAALAEGMDQAIGRLIDYLKTTDDPRNPGKKLSENTLVYFIADNGDAIKRTPQAPLKGMKGEYSEGGIRSVTIAWSEATWLANKGTVNHTPIIAFDLYPTLAEMAGASLPGGGYDIDGASQWQMLTNGTPMTREAIYWHFPGYLLDSKRDSRPTSIIRKGDYKLRYNYETLSYELYDLVNDMGEVTNLLAGSPDTATLTIANDMSTLLRNHLIDTNAPLPTYRSDGSTCPLPFIIDINGGGPNSPDGCQAVGGYEAYWDFDASEGADDASGNGHNPNPINGTLTYDTVDFVEGDQSVIFDGTVDINYSDATFLSPESTARSFSVWIKPTSLVGNQNIIEEGGLDDGIALRLEGSNLVSMLKDTGTDYSLSTAFPNDGNWHHVGFVFDGSAATQTIYIDGVVAISGAAPASIPTRNTTGGGIGGVIGNWDSFGAAGTESFFTGKMDAFAVYESALSASDIETSACVSIGGNSTAGCQATTGFDAYWDFDTVSDANDASGNNHDPISVTGSMSYDTIDFQEGDQSAIFNGATKVQYNDGTFLNEPKTNRTVSVWLKPDALNGGIQNIYDEGSNWKGITLRLNDNKIQARANQDTGLISAFVEADFDAAMDGEWHHVVLVFEGGVRLTLYVDGVEVATDTTDIPTSKDVAGNAGGIGGVFGSDAFGSNSNTDHLFYNGKMDAFAIYDYVLTLTDIEANACSNNVVAEAGPDVTICDGDSTILTASGGDTYLWSTGATTASINVSPSSTTVYTVTAFVGGNSDDDSVTVTVNALPTADAGADVTICDGDSTTLTATGGDTYLWSTGATTASINVSPSATTVYSVTVTTNGCSDNDDVTVTVNPLPTADAGADATICEGDSTTLSATGGDTYLWNTGATTASINVSPSSTTVYTVTVTTNGCSDNDSVTVNVNPLPTADAGADVTICDGDSTTLTASGGDTYLWSTGATTASINVSPSSTTVYSVTVTSNGCSDNDSVTVNVDPLPTADAGPDTTICEGDSTTLTASGGDTYLWSTGATTASINVSPNSTTIYSVTVTSNGCSDNDSVTVNVNPLPTADAGPDVGICSGDSTTLTASGGDTYLWSTGATTASINVSPSSTTVYTVTVTTNGCSSNDSVTVTVGDPVIADAGPDVGICSGDSTTLTATGGDTYLWSTGATTASINVSPSSTTVYSVTVTTNGCSDNDSVIVNVNPTPTADAGADVSICEGDSTTLTASGGDTYLWSTGATTASINVSPISTTVYSVTVTSNGCSDNDDVTVTVNAVPVADAGADVTICDGDSTMLTASGGDTYLWSTGATTASINVSPSSTTVYSVTVTSNGCSDNDSVTVNVDPTPTADAGADATICDGDSTTLTASGGDTYLWNTGATTASINVSPSSTTVYTVTVTSNGCSDNDSVTVNVNPLPNADAGPDVAICEGDSTTLIANGGDTYLWNTGATTASINVSPSSTTVYFVTVTTNGCSSNDDVTVTVNTVPVADAGKDETICEGDNITLTASGGDTYLWSTGATTASINVSPSSTTVYTVTATSNGCSDNDSVTVNVNPTPTADAGADVAICDGDSTTLTASGGDSYLWSTGATTASINVSPSSTTVYSVNVTTNGCSDNDSVTVTVNAVPVADAGSDVTICDGDLTTLTASGGDTYLWSTGATTSSISVSPSSTTVYSVTVTSNGCSDNDSVTVNINPTPTADAGPDVTITEGDSTTLTASGGGTYLWNTGATTASINVSPTSDTTYTVTVTSNGCSNQDSVTVTVEPDGCSYSLINSEGFESGWGIWNDGGSDARLSANDANYATTGTYAARIRDNTDTSVITTDDLDLTAYEELTVDFAYYARSMDNSNEDFWLQISTDGGSNYTTVEEWNRDDEFLNNTFNTGQAIISGPFTANTRLRFRCDASGNNDQVYLDDIVINGCSTSGGSRISVNKPVEVITEDESSAKGRLTSVLYPNPFDNEVNIRIVEGYDEAEVEVFNMLGQRVSQQFFRENALMKISLDNVESGQYFIKVKVDNQIIMKRAIKK